MVVCKYYLEGRCRFGNKCANEHPYPPPPHHHPPPYHQPPHHPPPPHHHPPHRHPRHRHHHPRGPRFNSECPPQRHYRPHYRPPHPHVVGPGYRPPRPRYPAPHQYYNPHFSEDSFDENNSDQQTSPYHYLNRNNSSSSGADHQTGSSSHVEDSMQEHLTLTQPMSNKFVKKTPSILDAKLVYLKTMLCGKNKAEFSSRVEKALANDNLKGQLSAVNGEVTLVTTTEESHIKCSNSLDKLIHSVDIAIPTGTPPMTVTTESVSAELKRSKLNHLALTMSEENVNILSFDKAYTNKAKAVVADFIEGFLYKNMYVCNLQESRFIIKHLSSSFPDVNFEVVQNGLKVIGGFEKVHSVIEKLKNTSFKSGNVTFVALKLSEYFSSKEWIDFVDDLETKVNCILSLKKVKDPISGKTPPVSVKVRNGNIVNETSDVIINGVSGDFNLDWGSVSQHILKVGGKAMQDQCTSNPVINAKYVRVTDGFNLWCKYVAHVVTPSSLDELTRRIKTALDHAEHLQATSVSLPTIGAGGIGLDADGVAKALLKAFEEFIGSHPTYVKNIKVVVFEQPILPLFQEIIKIKTDKHLNEAETHYVRITSANQTSLDKALLHVNKHKSNILCEVEIGDSHITKFENNEWKEIEDLSKEIGASCVISQNSSPKITISGLKNNVAKLKKKITSIIHQFVDATVFAKICKWKWERESPEEFVNLPVRISKAMETEFNKSKKDKLKVKVCGEFVKFDFSKMQFTSSERQGAIRREDKTASAYMEVLPPEWVKVNGKVEGTFIVPFGTPEYNEVLQHFKKSNPTYRSILKIERVQLPVLYQQYQIKKKAVERGMANNDQVERNLFHGTSITDAGKICAKAFNRSYAGKNATVYGKGSYFAVKSSYSVRYSNNTGWKCVFVAQVLTGNYCQGNSSLVDAPLMGFQIPLRSYDSVVNKMNDPTIFVVFNDTSVYPKYLITFQ